MNMVWRYSAFTVLALAAGVAQAASPVGLWRTIDDETGKERSYVRIVEVDGKLQGTVEKLFEFPGDNPDHLCDKCSGERKDKPIVGMQILWDLKNDDDVWKGGYILDPNNGKTYRCKMTVSEDGQQMDVRGYIGISLLGRTQTWFRLE
jgi:uncharacterized protein (DUF2147 family)